MGGVIPRSIQTETDRAAREKELARSRARRRALITSFTRVVDADDPVVAMFHHTHHALCVLLGHDDPAVPGSIAPPFGMREGDTVHSGHHCGNGEGPGADILYRVEHCKHGLHAINGQTCMCRHVGLRGAVFVFVDDPMEFTEECAKGWWHIRSGRLTEARNA